MFLMHAFGPVMLKLLHTGLMGITKANFEKNTLFRANFNKILGYSFLLLCAILILDVYSLATISYQELVFCLSFTDLVLNSVIGFGYIFEYLSTFK